MSPARTAVKKQELAPVRSESMKYGTKKMYNKLVFKYQRETLYWATRALQEDKQQNYAIAEEYYSKASRSMSCAVSFEENELAKRVLSNMLKTYESRLLFIQELKKSFALQQQQDTVFSQTTTTTTTTTSIQTAMANQRSSYYGDLTAQQEHLSSFTHSHPPSDPIALLKDIDEYTLGTQPAHYRNDPEQEYYFAKAPSFHDISQLNQPNSITTKSDDRGDKYSFKECMIRKGDVSLTSPGFKQVVGLEEAIRCLKEAVILPQQHPMLFRGARKPWRAILLYGPPGTGKTLLAKALAQECKANFFSVSSADLLSKWMGQSEKRVKELFERANEMRPSVIFIDEIDSLCSSRNDQDSETAKRVKTELLVQMQGLDAREENVFVLAATNLPWQLDSAVRRRFEKRIYIPLPDKKGIRKLLESSLVDTPTSISSSQLEELAERMDGYSCSDVEVVCRAALMEPIRKLEGCKYFVNIGQTLDGTVLYRPSTQDDIRAVEKTLCDFTDKEQINYIPEVTFFDFETSIKKNKSSISPADLEQCENFTLEYGQQ